MSKGSEREGKQIEKIKKIEYRTRIYMHTYYIYVYMFFLETI